MLMAGGCGRIGVEVISQRSDNLEDASGVSAEPDAQTPPDALGDAGMLEAGVEVDTGSPTDAGPGSTMPDVEDEPAIDAAPACVPLSSAALAALAPAACRAFTPCPGETPPVDTDGDRAPDACDPCRLDPNNDADGDGYCSNADNCPALSNGDQADSDTDAAGDACDADDDNDGVPDATDNCRLVRNVSQTDADADGRGDACDNDLDGDGVPDANDNCPAVANASQANSDGAADGGDACDLDDDNDGVTDGSDNCALVANPSQTNSDGTADGGDACDPDDDNDGVPDTSDTCPLNPGKAAPGVCGCAYPENCQALIAGLTHRYRFSGTGNAITDSVGGANGDATTALSGTGSLSLSSSAQYATLPSQLVSGYSAATIEFWLTWRGGSQNQRAISFGTATPAALNITCNGGSYCTGTNTLYNQGSWYHFCSARTCTWDDASNGCRAAGGYLVQIDSATEQQYIATHPDWSDVSLWLGGNDRSTEGQWYWSSATADQGPRQFWSGAAAGSAVGGAYTNWDTNEPSNSTGTKDCAFLYKTTMKWWAWDCTGWGGHSVCEWHGHQSGSIDRGVWFTPSDSGNRPRLSYRASGTTSTATGSTAFAVGTETHVALVLNPGANSVALYINGALAGSVASTAVLSELRDGDNWLGRSQLTADPALNASFSELRIYNRALSLSELQTSVLGGPDAPFLE
jgi:Concanavalin A-like lectin/glucanases superfamily/Thrombospondin type 3 repeat/Lectin C-type domain